MGEAKYGGRGGRQDNHWTTLLQQAQNAPTGCREDRHLNYAHKGVHVTSTEVYQANSIN